MILNLALYPAVCCAKAEVDRLAAQVMMVGIYGPTPSHSERSHLQDLRPGSYVLFSRNIVSELQTRALTDDLQKLCSLGNSGQCLIGVDQEGGLVSRIPRRQHFLSPRFLAQLIPQTAEDIAFEVGRTLKPLGINVNLAPVLDLQNVAGTSFLRTRAFGSNPKVVGTFGTAFSRGLLSAGVLPTAKHFPGLGYTEKDPHFYNSIASESSSLLISHLIPFRNFVDDGMPIIMMSHSVYPSLDPFNPAFQSPKIVNQLLRTQFGFKGLIVSDDLQMVAAQTNGGIGESAVRALEAGVDVLMVSYSVNAQKTVHRAIVSALESGRLSQELMKQKINRLQISMKRAAEHTRGIASLARQEKLSFRSIDLEKLNKSAFRSLLLKHDFNGASTVYVFNSKLYHSLRRRYGPKIRLIEDIHRFPETATFAIDSAKDLNYLKTRFSSLNRMTVINFSTREFRFPEKRKMPKSIINVFGPHYQFLDVVFKFKPSEPMKFQREVSANLE